MDITLLLARVTVTASGCWLWSGSRTSKGYPRLKAKGTQFFVHRLVLEDKLGRPLSKGEQACHACDNPPCIRPSHLFPGTQKDNIRDAMSKGRMAVQDETFFKTRRIARGVNSGMAKITDEIVREIRKLRREGMTQQAIADQLGLLQPLVSRVLRRVSWAHVTD